MSWQPAQESLAQLAACLKDSLSGFDKNAQKRAELVSFPLLLPDGFPPTLPLTSLRTTLYQNIPPWLTGGRAPI